MVVSVIVRGPEWFFGLDSAFEAFAGLALLLITLFSFKAYRFTKDKRYRTFAIGFGLMTIGVISRAITDFLVYVDNPMKVVLLMGGYALYMGATLAALVVLFALTLKVKQKAPCVALFVVSLVLILFSSSYRLSFHSVAVILLAFISVYFIQNYVRKKSWTAFFVCAAFVLLTLTHGAFMVDIIRQRFYIVGHLLHVGAFASLLIALVRVLRPNKRHD